LVAVEYSELYGLTLASHEDLDDGDHLPIEDGLGLDPLVRGDGDPVVPVFDARVELIGIDPVTLALDPFFHRPDQPALVGGKVVRQKLGLGGHGKGDTGGRLAGFLVRSGDRTLYQGLYLPIYLTSLFHSFVYCCGV